VIERRLPKLDNARRPPLPGRLLQSHDCVAAPPLALRPAPWDHVAYNRPDATIITGEVLTSGEVQQLAERVGQNAEGVRIRVEDRMTEDADWY